MDAQSMQTLADCPEMEAKPWAPRYGMLDAWRGLAALGVVCYHLGYGAALNLGHLCVMLFFVISGYCIASSCESCLKHRYGFREYLWRRIRRIYPPYALAILFFWVTRLAKGASGERGGLFSNPVAWLQNLTLTQWTNIVFHPRSFASNNDHLFVAAFWSLNYEEQFYLVMGLALAAAIRWRFPILRTTLGLGLLAIVWNLRYPSLSFGFFIEYWVLFLLGVLVYHRLCTVRSRSSQRGIDLALVLFALVSIANCPHANVADVRSVWLEWAVASVFAITLVLLRRWDEGLKTTAVGKALCRFGLITYSLYLTHQFNLHSSELAASRLLRLGLPRWLHTPIQIAVLVSIAAVFWYFCERPFLNRPLDKRRVLKPVNTSEESAPQSVTVGVGAVS